MLREKEETLMAQIAAQQSNEQSLQRRITDMGKQANSLIKRLSNGFKLDASFKPADWLNLEESSDSEEPAVEQIATVTEKVNNINNKDEYYDEESDSDWLN